MNVCTDLCFGACCETFQIRHEDLSLPSQDVYQWLWLHGQVDGEGVTFDHRCGKLTKDGRCSIHEDPGRPLMCRDFQPGCADCRAAIRARRGHLGKKAVELILRRLPAWPIE